VSQPRYFGSVDDTARKRYLDRTEVAVEFRLMVDALQRPNWYGAPIELGELFILKKGRREATCKLRSHQFGWEVRLFVGRDEIVQTQVCRSQDEVLRTGEQWKAAMIEKGWR
jgi:hypothetical protein